MKPHTSLRLNAAARVALTLLVVIAVVFGPYLLGPRTKGLSADWSSAGLDGQVVAGRALVGRGNAALDLRTGRSVRLGSVVGGTAFYADDRLVIASAGHLDSVRLDATVRWTWQAAPGHAVIPLAAAQGSTLVADCPALATERCRLVGLDVEGKQAWETPDAGRPVDPPQASLPRVHAQEVEGGGVLVTDPASGRSSLQPGSDVTVVPDGPVVLTAEQGGECVVSTFASPDPLWTRVLGPCPGGDLPRTVVSGGIVALAWPDRTERLSLDTGATVAPSTSPLAPGALASAGSLVATRRVDTPLPIDLVRRGRQSQVLELRDASSGEVRARLVTAEPVTLLLLEPRAVVVREGDRVVRYSVDG